MDEKEIIDQLMRVEEHNASMMANTPQGRFPVCKNKIGTMICER